MSGTNDLPMFKYYKCKFAVCRKSAEKFIHIIYTFLTLLQSNKCERLAILILSAVAYFPFLN